MFHLIFVTMSVYFHVKGNIQIFHDGEWGTICDDEWDLYEAKIGN